MVKRNLSLVALIIISLTLPLSGGLSGENSVNMTETNTSINLTALDFSIDISPYTLDTYQYSYADWVQYHIDMGWVSDYLLGTPPEQVVRFEYLDPAEVKGFMLVEIYEYNNGEDAKGEFDLQYQQTDTSKPSYADAPIFERLADSYTGYMFQKNKFFVFLVGFATGQSHKDLLYAATDFLENMINKIETEIKEAPPPTVYYSGSSIIWGIQPGDIITWDLSESIQFQTKPLINFTWEISKISENNLAVQIKHHLTEIRIFGYFRSYYIDLGGEYEKDVYGTRYVSYSSFEWMPGVVDGKVGLKEPIFSQYLPIIIPAYSDQQTVKEFVKDRTDHLDEQDVTESATYVTGHAKTYTPSGYTPVETQWNDITVHKGTGILTNYDYYYNNNEYQTNSRTILTLKETNFNMGNRPPIEGEQSATDDSSEEVPDGEVPDSKETSDEGIVDENGFETPSFEFLMIITGITCLVIWRKKR